MQKRDPRWRKLGQNFIWFVLTMVVLAVLLRFLRSPVVLVALWGVGVTWGGFLAFKFSRLLFNTDSLVISDERSQEYLTQARDYQSKIEKSVKAGSSDVSAPRNSKELLQEIDSLTAAIDDLVERIGNLRRNEVIRRDLQAVPKAIKALEDRLNEENDEAIQAQLQRTLHNRRKQLDSLEALQNTIKRAEIQLESTLSQLGTIYSQLLTGQSTTQVADYSRLAADVDEEVQVLNDYLSALREIKLGES